MTRGCGGTGVQAGRREKYIRILRSITSVLLKAQLASVLYIKVLCNGLLETGWRRVTIAKKEERNLENYQIKAYETERLP